jgi:nitrogenase subunit NifH
LAVVPFDGDVAEAERLGQAVLDTAPAALAVDRVRCLAERLLASDVPKRTENAAD